MLCVPPPTRLPLQNWAETANSHLVPTECIRPADPALKPEVLHRRKLQDLALELGPIPDGLPWCAVRKCWGSAQQGGHAAEGMCKGRGCSGYPSSVSNQESSITGGSLVESLGGLG